MQALGQATPAVRLSIFGTAPRHILAPQAQHPSTDTADDRYNNHLFPELIFTRTPRAAWHIDLSYPRDSSEHCALHCLQVGRLV